MPETSDLQLVERWRAGDTDAGNQLLARYFDQIRGYFINAVGEREHLDLLQDTFERVIKAIPQFAGASSFRTYLFAIARRARMDFYRRAFKLQDTFKSSESSVEDIDGITPSTAVALLEGGRRLNACVRHLPIDTREMIELHYWHGWQATEIAELFELPDATVRTRMSRARELLRECLDTATEELARQDAAVELDEQLRALGRELGIPGARRAKPGRRADER